MKKAILITLTILSLVFTIPVYAIENSQTHGADQNQNLEQKKAEALKHIDERVEKLQQQKACIQAVQNNDDMKACFEKFKADWKEARHNMKMKHNNMKMKHNNMMEDKNAE